MAGSDAASIRYGPELLRVLVDRAPAMLAYWGADLRCIFANRAYELWFGVSPEALIGKHVSELLGPVYPLNRPYLEAALRGEPQEFERDFPDPAGGPPRSSLLHYIPDILNGAVVGIFVHVSDVSELKRAQTRLRESEERFRLAVDEAPIGMALVALDGRFVRVNRVLCEIVGYTAAELVGLSFQTITHPDDLDTDVKLAGRLARGEIPRYQLEKRYLRKDGTIVDVMLSASIVRDGRGEAVSYIAQIEDIGERTRLEKRLRLAEAQSRGILAISADAIISVDESQRITMFNEGAEQIFGYGQDEVLGAPLDILIPGRVRAIHRQHVDAFAGGSRAARRMGERGGEIVGRRKQGDEFPAEAAISRLDVGGRTVLTVALRDVTERRRLEAEQEFLAEVGPVLASSFAYEETLSKVADLAVRDLADLCIVDLIENGRVRRLKTSTRGAAPVDARDASVRVGLDGDGDDVLRSVRESRLPLVAGGLVAVPIVAHDELLGTLALVSWTAQGPRGAAVLRLAVELARRAALAIENGRLYEAAQRATQARDDLLGIVAHDLRNPLNSILMAAGLLRPRGFAERRSQRPGEIIERSAKRMNHLIEDLLEVTRMEAGRLPFEPGSLSPEQVIADAIEAQKPLVTAASLEIQAEVPLPIMNVWADRDRLLQIFENLIGNAVKFTPAHGHVSVGAEQGEDEVTFRVADTGAGIVDDDLPHLFDRFWQGDRAKRGGAGLGLPIVKGIVDAHGGRIWVRSAPGRGTTFFFTLPTVRKAEQGRPISP